MLSLPEQPFEDRPAGEAEVWGYLPHIVASPVLTAKHQRKKGGGLALWEERGPASLPQIDISQRRNCHPERKLCLPESTALGVDFGPDSGCLSGALYMEEAGGNEEEHSRRKGTDRVCLRL